MMAEICLLNAEIYTGESIIESGYVLIEDEKITQVGMMEDYQEQSGFERVIDLNHAARVVPGFIDLHIHGAHGADVMDASLEALQIMTSKLPLEGTTSFLATTMTSSKEQISEALVNAAAYLKEKNQTGAEILGIHLEGPFLNPKRAGAQAPGNIIEPSIDLFDRWHEESGGSIKLVTLAPEREGGYALAGHLKSLSIVPSIGHSDAVYQEVETAIASGVHHATHLFNGMRGIHHRDAGTAGAVLMKDEVITEMIVDGIHIAPEMVKFAYRMKGSERAILITDAMRAKGLGPGTYDLGGQEVTVDGERATLADGTLAGSILTFRDAVVNMMSFTGCSLQDAVTMSSVNPAKQIGVYDRKGSLEKGKDADIAVLDDQLNVMMTICRGTISFTGSADK